MVERKDFAAEDDEAPIIYVTEVLVDQPYTTDQSSMGSASNTEWTCSVCTLINLAHKECCEACENPGPLAYSRDYDQEGNNLQNLNQNCKNDDYEEAEVQEVVDLGESPWAKKMRRRRRRKGRVCVGAVGGAVVGGVLGCGIGAIAGALAGGMVARKVSRCRERRKDERLAQHQMLPSVETDYY